MRRTTAAPAYPRLKPACATAVVTGKQPGRPLTDPSLGRPVLAEIDRP